MRNKFIYILGCLILVLSTSSILAQDTTINAKHNVNTYNKLLVRDSLDFINKPLSINTTSNEFSPIPYKGGLMYISNKPVPSLKASFNKVYWSKDPNYNIADSAIYRELRKDTSVKYYRKGKSDDFTAPTSNDNDILVIYRRNREKYNDVEKAFLNFSTEQVFTYSDTTGLLVYAKKSSRKINGVKHWELWQANLVAGKLRHKKRIDFDLRDADYLHPYFNELGTKLYFASNRAGGKGGYDLYTVPVENGLVGTHPVAFDEVNTASDEIMPSVKNDTLYFSSNREGGLGGFDAYVATNMNTDIKNLGYPINSDGDDVGVKMIDKDFYLTSNRYGNFDILKLKYEPSVFTIMGSLAYNADSTLAPSQSIYVKDNESGKLIAEVKSDVKGNYAFNGKPNRSYELTTVNGNGVTERFTINTDQTPLLLQSKNLTQRENQFKYDLAIKVGGMSVKQKADSVRTYLAMEQKRIADSLISYGLNNKFIVHYGFNKHNIAAKEQLVLDSLLRKLQYTPKAYVVVGGFTDCIGSYKYNLQLSIKRGKAVVAYLTKHGLSRKNIVLTGYSKKYNVSPCVTKFGNRNKTLQQDSRRSEIVLSETKQTNWATLEKQRGANYYTVYSNKNLVAPKAPVYLAKVVAPVVVKKDTVVKAIVVVKPVVKKDTVAVAKVVPVVVKKDTVAKVIVAKPIVKKDTIAVAKVAPVVVKKDTVAVVKVASPKVVKKDTVAKVVATVVVKKDTIAKTVAVVKPVVKKDTVAKSIAIVAKPVVKKDTIAKTPIVVTQAKQVENDDLSKEDIIKALDSLAKLKREQERIVEYLTMRINNKPIDIYVSSDSVTVELYDNGIHDKDSVSVIYNNRLVVDKQELKVNNPIKFKLKVDKNKKNNELIMVAENLGTEPPNTAVMFITEKSGRRQQVVLNTDMTHNGVVYFIRIGKTE